MKIEDEFYINALRSHLKEIRDLSSKVTSEDNQQTKVLSYIYQPSLDPQYDMLYLLQEWGLIRIIKARHNRSKGGKTTTLQLTPLFESTYLALEAIWYEPFIEESIRVAMIKKLLGTRRADETSSSNLIDNQRKYWLDVKETGEIVINDKYILSKPRIDSDSENFISYAITHPGQDITKIEIQEDSGKIIERAFSSLLNDLGFRHAIKQLFFPKTSKNCVRFINPITEEIFSKMQIDIELLDKQLSEFRKVENKK